MEKDMDKKLYNDYLNGNDEAFEILYLKYKDKIRYFIYNIVKDYEKAEDITQEVFIYICKNKVTEESSFKYYLFLIAKSRAITYLNTEKRRKEIVDKYLSNDEEKIENDVLEIITKQEEKEELIKAINSLNEKYRNAIYLNKIEDFSYEETAKLLNTSVANVRNLIHRGKKELQKILIKKGFNEMNKVSKIIILILCISFILTGGVYATTKIIGKITGKAKITPTYTSKISSTDTNKV